MPPSTQSETSLARRIGLPLLTLYGIGNLIGGGFYALVGKVSGLAGPHMPLAFAIAALVATFSALSFCELSARHPVSGGPASYVEAAFGARSLTLAIGAIMVITGIISAATLASAVDGFVQDLSGHPRWLGITVVVAALTGIAVWGISESVWLAVAITLVETGGIVYVGVVSAGAPVHVGVSPGTMLSPGIDMWPGILMGAFLSFYAYVGFEDLVTLAEEVERPRKTMPRAILLAVGATTVLYVVVGALALTVVPPDELVESRTPLATVVERAGGSPVALGWISVFAGANGALVQIIMGARIIYSLASDSERWRPLAHVNAFTRTPIRATLLVAAMILVLALFFPLVTLARVTSFSLLAAFLAVNAALVKIKRRGDEAPPETVVYPAIVPWTGAVLCVAFLAVEAWRLFGG